MSSLNKFNSIFNVSIELVSLDIGDLGYDLNKRGNERLISILPLNGYFIVFYEIENTWAKLFGLEDIKIVYAQINNGK